MAQHPHFELVRETLKALADRKLPPTPDNYQSMFSELFPDARENADDTLLVDGLLSLFRLIVDNMQVLTSDEGWIQGQIMALRHATEPPLSVTRLAKVGDLLREVIARQAAAKQKADEAQAELRNMLAVFLERLTSMGASTGQYHGQLENGVQRIGQAKTVADIAPVLRDVMSATRQMSDTSVKMQAELSAIRQRSLAAEDEVSKLYKEINRLSNQVRHDALTGALNRHGLEDALTLEIARVRRTASQLCLAMLDIDNFKKLNDTRGHDAGDGALAHLARVVREALRPQDTLARYGGEEFVVLLPDTSLDDAVKAMKRLQRELTTRLFLAGEDQILITFSAGVSQLGPHETGIEALKRADVAMYQAKRAGKNRVYPA